MNFIAGDKKILLIVGSQLQHEESLSSFFQRLEGQCPAVDRPMVCGGGGTKEWKLFTLARYMLSGHCREFVVACNEYNKKRLQSSPLWALGRLLQHKKVSGILAATIDESMESWMSSDVQVVDLHAAHYSGIQNKSSGSTLVRLYGKWPYSWLLCSASETKKCIELLRTESKKLLTTMASSHAIIICGLTMHDDTILEMLQQARQDAQQKHPLIWICERNAHDLRAGNFLKQNSNVESHVYRYVCQNVNDAFEMLAKNLHDIERLNT